MPLTLLTDPSEMCEPFAFDIENAEYLFSSDNVEFGSQRLKHAFRKSPKAEVVTMHILREKMALQGHLNALTIH